MPKQILFILTLIIGSFYTLHAQELKCQVSVTTPQIQSSDKEIYQTLQTAIYEMMNETKWTNYKYEVEEKIECSILINVTNRVSDLFTATIQVQVRRPVFNTSYNTVLLNYKDNDFTFEYEELQPLEFSENSYHTNLTAVLGYYAYLMIGLDFDSYSFEGGTPFFEACQTIVNYSQNAPSKGWKAFENRKNRYWIVENLLNKSYEGFRKAMYQYHRKGLDVMYDNKDNARNSIFQAIETLDLVHREKPGLAFMNLFFVAKNEEIVSIFSEGNPILKPKVIKICSNIDPSNSSKYRKMSEPSK